MAPRRFNFQDEISLRHLPDTSDTSFSFQIPNGMSGNDRLLDDNDISFFRDTNDVDVNLATPGPDRTAFRPFTLEELTPRPPSKVDTATYRDQSAQPMPIDSGSQANMDLTLRHPEQATRAAISKDRPRPNLRATTRSARSSAETKSSATEHLRGAMQELNNAAPSSSDSPPPTNTAEPSCQDESRVLSGQQERPVMKTERTRKKAVISGGIVKVQSKKPVTSSKLARNVVSVPAIQQEAQQEALLPPEPQSRVLSEYADFRHARNSDISICSPPPGGVAARLVMYSQSLLSSFGPAMVHNSDVGVPSRDDPELSNQRRNSIAENINTHQRDDGRDDPLTLSQISPSKTVNSHPFPPATVLPDLPVRRSTKRPASEPASPQPPASKKGRNSASTLDDPSEIIAPAVQSAGCHAPTKSSNSGLRKAPRAMQQTSDMRGTSKPTRRKPVSTCSTLKNSSQGDDLSRSDTGSSRSGHSTLRFSRSDNLAMSGTSVPGHGEAGSSRNTGMPRSHERDMVHSASTTKPAEFKFQIDARIEGRKAEFEKENSVAVQKPRKQYFHQVPDFKTLHAVEDARLALRKDNIAPTVPLPFQLSTDGRAREREKFEEHLRKKERELKRALEEKRREEEEIEESAIRELRKKAVPRAHEVPEWYKDVPKRKMRDLDTNRD